VYRATHNANSQQLADELAFLLKTADPSLRWLCIEASAIDDVDFTAAEVLRSIFDVAKEKGVRLVVAAVLSDMTAASHYGLQELVGADAFYSTMNDVIKDYQRQVLSAESRPSDQN
jgi:MFS superfamily sulfate permease-like transporter